MEAPRRRLWWVESPVWRPIYLAFVLANFILFVAYSGHVKPRWVELWLHLVTPLLLLVVALYEQNRAKPWRTQLNLYALTALLLTIVWFNRHSVWVLPLGLGLMAWAVWDTVRAVRRAKVKSADLPA